MSEGSIVAIYFVGVFVCAGKIVHSGLTGQWSSDDWPMFALFVPWFWPLLVVIVPFDWFDRRNSCKCWEAGDHPKCPWHGDGRFILPTPSTKREARRRGAL